MIALPYADADLVALTRGGMSDLAVGAITDGRTVLNDILQITAVPGATWPVDGVVDEPTLAAMAQADGRSVVLSADGVEQGRSQRTSGVVPIAGGHTPQFALLTDPLLTKAATGPGAVNLQDDRRWHRLRAGRIRHVLDPRRRPGPAVHTGPHRRARVPHRGAAGRRGAQRWATRARATPRLDG